LELFEQVLLRVKAISREDRRIESGVGVLEGVLAWEFQRPVDRAEAAGGPHRRGPARHPGHSTRAAIVRQAA
jgi:hypothetical protein